MSTYSKRIKIQTNILLEYIFDDTNFKSEDYKVLTNLKDKTKSFMSSTGNNTIDNSLFLIDPVLNKYSPVNVADFNFLKVQDYFSSPIIYDKIRLYFPSGFDFYTDYLGFYLNIYAMGYGNNILYSLSNFFYVKSNTNVMSIFDLPNPFYYDEKYWVRYIDIEFPSPNSISSQRIIYNNLNEPKPDSINYFLTYNEGLAQNSLVFVDFSFITAANSVLGVNYYYVGDLYSASLPQVPEFTELGVNVTESTQGDFFEIYATYLGSNESMDEFAYDQQTKGITIQLEYVVNLYEENILTTTQTYIVTDNFTNKIYYRPVIQFSNTTALIDVELKIVNVVDGSYISKFGTCGITNSINKYGLRLTRLNVDSSVMKPTIYNLKMKNVVSNISGNTDSINTIMKVPYPVMVDKYRILAKNPSDLVSTSNYTPNGLLEILITSFDTVINFIIAQDINSKGEPIPYNLSSVSLNSKILLVFKSDSEKLEKEPMYDANNQYEFGNISYKVLEGDYQILRKIYNKGFNNFYIVINANNINTQLYSGKFMFYEDVTFLNTTTGSTNINVTGNKSVTTNNNTAASVAQKAKENNPFNPANMPIYIEVSSVDKNYYNLLVFLTATPLNTYGKLFDNFLKTHKITPKIIFNNTYYLERIYSTMVTYIQNQTFIYRVFIIPLGSGMAANPANNK